ncbi:Transcription termination factor like [Actinidia chinensis var. chinensis]|uniref:Transcription termination factor like n=1 Tax=Actinidia chinensis var. chinensis TaxID=1590841 RepID=A0A2R6Q634_ACTCC|nr:Transcription termination factor like [Actinidia chinensis var. chinensis]
MMSSEMVGSGGRFWLAKFAKRSGFVIDHAKRSGVRDSTTKISSPLLLQELQYLRRTSREINSSTSTTITANCTNQHLLSFTVGDVIKSCDLPHDFGVRCKSSENPNSVLKLLQSCGFSQTQVRTIVSKYPNILLCNPRKNIKPKIDFLRSVLISEADVLNMVTAYPFFLKRSLKNHLVPSVHLLITSLGGQQNAMAAIKRHPIILDYNVCKNLVPNLSTLRNLGVPKTQISKMMTELVCSQVIAGTRPEWFCKVVSTIMEMGFDPLSARFRVAVNAMAFCTETTWEGKLNFYTSLGFSSDEVLYMFRKRPHVFCMSEETVRGAVEFYIDKLDGSIWELSTRPKILTYSLEKRIIPRCLIVQILLSRHQIHKNVKVDTIMQKTECEFLDKYVMEYKDEIPLVLDAYEGNIKFDGPEFDWEEMRRLSPFKILI